MPFHALLRSEWTRLRSLRSTWWCTALYLVVVGGSGWLAAAGADTASRSDAASSVALMAFAVGPVLVVVAGALAVTADLGSAAALASLTAVPRRTRLLLAKTLVVAGYWALLAAVPAAVRAAAATLTAVPGGEVLAGPDALRVLALQVTDGALVAVLGVALGAVLRSAAGAVGMGTALVLVLPPAFAPPGGGLAPRISQALPGLRLGEDAFHAVTTTWPVGTAVVAAWSVVAWVLGAVLLERRDV